MELFHLPFASCTNLPRRRACEVHGKKCNNVPKSLSWHCWFDITLRRKQTPVLYQHMIHQMYKNLWILKSQNNHKHETTIIHHICCNIVICINYQMPFLVVQWTHLENLSDTGTHWTTISLSSDVNWYILTASRSLTLHDDGGDKIVVWIWNMGQFHGPLNVDTCISTQVSYNNRVPLATTHVLSTWKDTWLASNAQTNQYQQPATEPFKGTVSFSWFWMWVRWWDYSQLRISSLCCSYMV